MYEIKSWYELIILNNGLKDNPSAHEDLTSNALVNQNGHKYLALEIFWVPKSTYTTNKPIKLREVQSVRNICSGLW